MCKWEYPHRYIGAYSCVYFPSCVKEGLGEVVKAKTLCVGNLKLSGLRV